ncbi:MAG: 16S rRNA (cytidine(1402)-2'-O)-methyltransferase [Cyclobacteriaceae bacterium]|jgi:16S rRNA (cytidine1402-2'-O)-methyltransferase
MSDIALHLVPTPIGNLADITLRALEVLKSADVILAEDTRTSRVLLNHYNIDRPLQSYHIFNEHQAVAQLIDRMKKGERFALISDAGTPGISDPGFLLVRETLKAGLTVDCLPGPTAFIPALIKSGFPTDRFVFEGFLPHKKGRQTALKQLAHEPRTVVLYESPHRLKKLLEELSEHVGTERLISVSRELTKKFEETVTGPVRDVQACFADRDVKGELVIVIHGEEN